MKKMQRGYLKFVATVFLVIFYSNSHAQSSFRLKTADSLFTAKQYTQSFEHYEQILKQQQLTPAMLLKMAYIKEGLAQIGPALYYLNLYCLATKDKNTLDKMNELATKYNLQGYDTSDAETTLAFFHDYHLYISLTLASLMILMFSIALYTKFKLKRRPIASFVIMVIFAIALFFDFSYSEKFLKKGIVSLPSTYVMGGPSAAAPVVEIIGDGHRVEILGQTDVWTKIEWDGTVAYIKQNALLPIRL